MPKKQESNGNIEVYLEDVRLSHPHLWEPQAYKKDPKANPRYSASFILDKKKHKKLIAEIDEAIDEAMFQKWGDDPPRIKDDNICFIDGDDTDRPEYQGCMVLKSASPENKPPKVLDKNTEPLDERSGKPYGGCYVNAIVRIFAYDKFGDQVNCSLEAVQYFRKGDAFGPAPVDTSRFKDHGEDDDDVTPMRRSRSRRDDDDDDDDRPARRRSSREEVDDDDRPARRRSSREDDDPAPRSRRAARDEPEDDEPPARRRGRGRDEDDDAPRGRRSSRDEDDAPRGRRRSSRDED